MKKVFLHIGIMIIVAVAIGWLAMLWLDVWTRHDDTITVPPVKTLSYGEAAARLDQHGLVAVLSDSVYDKSTRPGTVIDQNPKVGTIVKEGREIYLTINAFSQKWFRCLLLPTYPCARPNQFLKSGNKEGG